MLWRRARPRKTGSDGSTARRQTMQCALLTSWGQRERGANAERIAPHSHNPFYISLAGCFTYVATSCTRQHVGFPFLFRTLRSRKAYVWFARCSSISVNGRPTISTLSFRAQCEQRASAVRTTPPTRMLLCTSFEESAGRNPPKWFATCWAFFSALQPHRALQGPGSKFAAELVWQ